MEAIKMLRRFCIIIVSDYKQEKKIFKEFYGVGG